MNNAVYGKSCESKRRRIRLTFARDADQVLVLFQCSIVIDS